jgi:UDP-glucose 4-epimerase
MKILIAGGFGFLGGRLAQHFTCIGHEVTLGSRRNLFAPEWLPSSTVVQMEWNDPISLFRLCKGFDVVIHAAGMNALDSQNNPEAAAEFNGTATGRLAAAAMDSGVGRFVYFSTAHVYGSPLRGLISEEVNPVNTHPYASSHLAGEQAIQHVSKTGELDCTIIRLANAFGAPSHKEVNCWGLLANDLCQQAVTSGSIVLKSNGKQFRDFVPISTVNSVTNTLIEREYKAHNYLTVNVGSAITQPVVDLAKLVQARCEAVLHFTPEIHVPNASLDEHKQFYFQFKSSFLDLNELTNMTNVISEMDDLLRFCKANF